MTRGLTYLTAAALVLVLSGCQTVTGRPAGAYIDDKAMAAKVKTKLTAEQFSNLTRLDVDTVDGVVYLTGIVDQPEDKARAERVAQNTEGVRQVVSNIQVRMATGSEPRPQAGVQASQRAEAQAGVVAASPATGAYAVTGRVTEVDQSLGRLRVSTAQGEMNLLFPPESLRGIQAGDTVTVEMGVRPLR